ncbi:MAG: low specificity L-threonine aldolase [Proteobacteria bacterium]|nr:MAG: low specificity L-threonine aldolase [Pseudomonadota bacterium]PIE17966.1 MAG: low specificity L-threonine aldolase [Pseudomonadota bacterium]
MNDPIVDLRSDTMTTPTLAMREAMARAEVGDDVWGEDPTVKELERRCGELLGLHAGLFVPSGTMANQLALLVHCERGDEVLGPWGCHVANDEGGAAAALAGAHVTEVGETGLLTAAELEARIRAPDTHAPRTRLLWLENTHNRGGGLVFPREDLEGIVQLGRRRELKIHLDGARLLNAQVAAGVPARELIHGVDSTSLCFSKGLGAPAGSVLVGDSGFIDMARRWRKRLGGGMRQVGVLAAAAIHALDHHVERLAEDHANARVLAEGFAALPGLELMGEVQSNIVVFEVSPEAPSCAALLSRCADRGVLLCPFGATRLRAVTHLDVDKAGCRRAIDALRAALNG